MKYKIYALINPIDDNIFYVGATKAPLEERLKGHCSVGFSSLPETGFMRKRTELIFSIRSAGKLPIIILLAECLLSDVDNMEKFYYEQILAAGYDLLQSKDLLMYSTMTRSADVELSVT